MAKKDKAIDFNKDFAAVRDKQSDNVGGVIGRMTTDKKTEDSFVNFAAKLGIQTNNLSSQSYYNLGPYITRNRIELEAAYRGNWLVGKVVDCIAEDMTQAGITMNSEMAPDDITQLQVAISEFNIWHDLCNTIKWARLYGGCLAVILIDGAKYDTPLDIEKIGKDKFKGLVVLDRWMTQPSMGQLITTICKDIGKPEYYEVLPGAATFPSMKIHHTRVLRFEGIELPYYQRLFENLWGLSVVERMLDRLTAFDSATLGAAQMAYKSHLRIISVDGFREALAAGGKTEEAVLKQFQYIRAMQSNEGLTVLDAKDKFEMVPSAFGGLAELLQQFGQQISGAADIPLIRLFGQSPAGFNTGETDVRNYYDHIHKRQENELRPPMEKLLAVISMSKLGKPLPEDFEHTYVSLWQMSEAEKSEIAVKDAATITSVFEKSLISPKTALLELKQSSRVTNRFSNISNEDIEEAEDKPPEATMPGILPGGQEEPKTSEEGLEEEADKPNERLGGANPDIEEEKASKVVKDRISFRDIWEAFKGRKKEIKQTMDAGFKEPEKTNDTITITPDPKWKRKQ